MFRRAWLLDGWRLDRRRLYRSRFGGRHGLRRLHNHFVSDVLYAGSLARYLERFITRSVVGNLAGQNGFAIFYGHVDIGPLDLWIGKHFGLDIGGQSLVFLGA